MGEVFEAVRTGPGGFRRAVALKRLIGDGAVGYELATGTAGWRRVGGGAALDAIAWAGDELIVSASGWRQIRASADALAVVTTEVAPVLSLLRVP